MRAKDQLEEFNQEFGEPLRREEEGLEKVASHHKLLLHVVVD